MSYIIAPIYMGCACIMSMSYSIMENINNQGNYMNVSTGISIAWCICSIIIGCIIAAITGEMSVGMASGTHILIMILLFSITLCISSSTIYWSA